MGANVLFRLTNKESFDQREPKQGEISFLQDTGEIYVDYNNQRVKYAEVNPSWDDLTYDAAPVNGGGGNGGENNGGSEQGQQEQENPRATPKDFLEYDENQCIIGLYPDTRLNDFYNGYWMPKCAYLEDEYAIGICNKAFYGQQRLYKASFPNVTTIGIEAFYDCTNLKSLSIPNVTTIPPGSASNLGLFQGCKWLKYINMPKVTSIPANAWDSQNEYVANRTIILSSMTKSEVEANRKNWGLKSSGTTIVCSDETYVTTSLS